jgi:hypothetical protein
MTKDGGTVSGDRLAELEAFPHRLVAAREQPLQTPTGSPWKDQHKPSIRRARA